MLSVRVLTAKDCHFCRFYKKYLGKMKFVYIEYDTDIEDKQEELDSWGIGNLPIVQIIDDKGTRIYQFPYSRNGYSPRALNEKIKQLNKVRGE